MSEDNGHDEPLEIVDEPSRACPPRLPPVGFALAAMLDALHVVLDGLSVSDPRFATLPFAADMERAIDRLADVRAHVRACYPSEVL